MNEEKPDGSETEERRTVLVRQYGLLPPLDWDQDCQEHLWMQNKLWNALVEIDQTARGRHGGMAGGTPDPGVPRREIATDDGWSGFGQNENRSMRVEISGVFSTGFSTIFPVPCEKA